MDEQARSRRMADWLQQIAITDQDMRRRTIMKALAEMKQPFSIQAAHLGNHLAQNIVAKVRDGSSRLIIGAHYDSYPGSTGANDNGAAVCILLEIIYTLQRQPPSYPLEIVFFDLEEKHMVGSQVIVKHYQYDGIAAMINLDLCGVGETIVIGPAKNAEAVPFVTPLQKVNSQPEHRTRVIELMPPSDDMSLESARIPNLSVCTLDDEDVEAFIELAHAMYEQRAPKQIPTIADTMHNGKRDSIDVVDPQTMNAVFRWTLDMVLAFDSSQIQSKS